MHPSCHVPILRRTVLLSLQFLNTIKSSNLLELLGVKYPYAPTFYKQPRAYFTINLSFVNIFIWIQVLHILKIHLIQIFLKIWNSKIKVHQQWNKIFRVVKRKLKSLHPKGSSPSRSAIRQSGINSSNRLYPIEHPRGIVLFRCLNGRRLVQTSRSYSVSLIKYWLYFNVYG